MDTNHLATAAMSVPHAHHGPSGTASFSQPALRLTCPTCGKRLRLPYDFALRSGSAPCPRCAAAVVWRGSLETPPVATATTPTHHAPVHHDQPLAATLVMRGGLVSPAHTPTPPPVVQAPAPQPTSTPTAVQPGTVRSAAIPPAAIHPAAVQPCPVQAAATPHASEPRATQPLLADAATPTRRPGVLGLSWPWIVGLVVGTSACGSIAMLTLVLIVVTARTVSPQPTEVTDLASQQLQSSQAEVERARRANLELEQEVAQLRHESQTLQNEIEQLKKLVL